MPATSGSSTGTSPKAIAVALVALTKCLLSRDPALAQSLEAVLQGATASGLQPSDLDLLRVLVEIGRV